MNLNLPKLLASEEYQERKRIGEVTQIMSDGLIEVTLTDGTLLIGKVMGGAIVGTPVFNRPPTRDEWDASPDLDWR